MGTYFQGSNSEIQSSQNPSSADGLQTLYLMNPNFHAPYSDAPHQQQQQPTPNMLLLNPNALNLANFSHAPPPPSPNHHHFVHGVTSILGSTTSNNSDDNSRPSAFPHHEITTAFHGFPAAAAPRLHYNLWGSVVNEPQPSPSSSSPGAAAAAADGSPQMGFRRASQQGLSLSLSSQQQQTGNNTYGTFSGEVGGGVGNSPSSVVSNSGMSSVQGVILGSKYLKAAQELLDEVVNVGNFKDHAAEKVKVKPNKESTSVVGEGSSGGGGGGDGGDNGDPGKSVAELSTVQRQELQMKKSKLVAMLDEVEQRYRQYHHQMQIVISTFEQTAGYGAARSYTALALKTISKQFRCLKDAISSQIRATSKALGEDDCLGAKVEGSRLRYVDHHLRQQRALQQLGMIQPNAWRPQRGLPERAVSILRAWLFEHFLHPYPKDSDKVMLAKQTGLTRSQVSNWFINARVRLWKPMVEEMYLEEIKEQEHKNNNGSSKESSKEFGSTSNNTAPESSSGGNAVMKLDPINILQSKQECFNNNHQQQNTSPTEISANSSIMSTSPNMAGSLQSHHTAFHHHDMQIRTNSPNKSSRIGASEMHNSPSSILSMEHHMEMKHNNNNNNIGEQMANNREEVNNNTKLFGYGAFSMEDIGSRFNNFTDHNHHHHQLASRSFQGNNGVSLTLGLPHNNNNENLNLAMPGGTTQHGFISPQNMHGLGRRLEINGSNVNGNEFCGVINATNIPPSQSSHSAGTSSYEGTIDIQNRKRFAAQLLPDFVA